MTLAEPEQPAEAAIGTDAVPDEPAPERGIAFLLPARGGAGGTTSVVQEGNELLRLGIPVWILCGDAHVDSLRTHYADLEVVANVVPFTDAEHLAGLLRARSPRAIVCTLATTPMLLNEVLRHAPELASRRLAYYIQDYEPLFHELGSREWRIAYDSYTALRGAVLFAKTDWIADVVEANHGVPVQRVLASIDHATFYPDLPRLARPEARLRVTAMLRPATPRRAPHRTAAVLAMAGAAHGDRLLATTFGCSEKEMDEYDLRRPGQEHHGLLRRHAVAALLRQTDLFLDASDYQAFGRTAIEAMACGAVPIVPLHGGAGEFARHLENAFVVDTRDERKILEAIHLFASFTDRERFEMALAALDTAARFTVRRAALSEAALLYR